MVEAPDEPVLIEIVEYQIDSDLDGIHCHCLFSIVDTNTTFWIRNLDWMPEINVQYWWSKNQLRLAE